ncbi:hypothetical protein [Actinoplanes sp. NPDC026619]|uniref:hypothetical protein n=1 Tax=Actinoplanes sp. NPDC026619 TaxID=3155798 RepID=UPI0034028AB1
MVPQPESDPYTRPDVLTTGVAPMNRVADCAADLLPEEVADHITELLTGLGRSANAIADRLAESGITGYRDEADRCPIARYLRHADPSLRSVVVLDGVIEICTDRDVEVTVPAPEPVRYFVIRFDLNRYPRLVTSTQPNPLADPGTTIRKEE